MVNLHLARGLIPVAKTHCVCVVASSVDTAHDALIISEEEDDKPATALIAINQARFWYLCTTLYFGILSMLAVVGCW